MERKGESFLSKYVGWVFGAVAVVIIAVVAISIAEVDIPGILNLNKEVVTPEMEEDIAEWERFIVGDWEYLDNAGAESFFQFHDIGRYDYFLKINRNGGGFGNWNVIEATDTTATFEMTPTADTSEKWNLYLWKIDYASVDIRLGSRDGSEFTRLTRYFGEQSR